MPSEGKFNKFLFENDFFEVSGSTESQNSPSAEEGLQEAEQRGYQAGLAEGRQQAEQEISQQVSTHLGQLQEHLDALTQAKEHQARLLEQTTLVLLKDLLHIAFNDIASQYSQDLLKQGVAQVVAQAAQATKVKLFVNPQSLAFIEQHKPEIIQRDDIAIEPRGDLSPGSCCLEWETGGIRLCHEELRAKLEDILSAATHTQAPEGTSLEDSPLLERSEEKEVDAKASATDTPAEDSAAPSDNKTPDEEEDGEKEEDNNKADIA